MVAVGDRWMGGRASCMQAWVVALLMIVTIAVVPRHAWATEYTGNGSSIDWSISGGVLTIRPISGTRGVLKYNERDMGTSNPPWWRNSLGIRSVVVPAGCTIECRGSMYRMFDGCDYLTSIDVSGWDVSQVTSMNEMFSECSFRSLDVSGWDTGALTSMREMFSGCSSLETLDVSGWNMSSVTDMYEAFYGCRSLTSLDVSGWDTGAVTTTRYMFYGCSSLETLDVSNWDMGEALDIIEMFRGCSALTELDVSNWDTSKVTNLSRVFQDCSGLTSIDVSDWNTSQVATSMDGVFRGCSSLVSLDLSGWDTSTLTLIDEMFYECSSLVSLDISGWDTSNARFLRNIFDGCTSLSSVTLGDRNVFVGVNSSVVSELPTPPAEATTGKWVRSDGSMESKTPVELRNDWQPSWAGEWVWERKAMHAMATFDAGGGALYGTSTFETTEPPLDVTAPRCVRPGYRLTGWQTTADSTRQVTLGRGDVLTLEDGDDLRLEPVWEAVGLSLDGNTLEVTLHAGERATLVNELPAGVRYSVTERLGTGWSEVGMDGATGSVASGVERRALATNAYGVARATLRGTKAVDGLNGAAGYTFDFYEVGADGSLTRCGEATSSADGTFAFAALSYSDVGTHRYVVLERVGTNGVDGMVAWDTHAEHVTVEVMRDANGALGATVVTDEDGIVFTNARRRSALAVTKVVEGMHSEFATGFPVTVDVAGEVAW